MKFKVTVETVMEFEVPDDELQETYGTTDPQECARIEEQNPSAALLSELPATRKETKHRVEVVR